MNGPRRVLPSRTLLLAALPLMGLALASLFSPLPGLAWLAYALTLALLVLLDFAVRPRGGVIAGERVFAAGGYVVGRTQSYRLVLTNRGRGPLGLICRELAPEAVDLEVETFAFRLRGGEQRTLVLDFTALERGRFLLGPACVRMTRPFGVLTYQEELPARNDLRVLPGRPAGETEALLARAAQLAEQGERKLRRRGADREFESLREYVVGDDLRFVDWKSTAKRRRPTVRQFQMERNAEIVLALDCGRLMGGLIHGVRKLDLAMTSLLDLAAVALRRGDRVGLLAFDAKARAYVPPRRGTAQLGRLRDVLADLDTSFEQTSYSRALIHLESHHRKRSLVVALTDFTDEISARDMVAVMAALVRRHRLVFAGVSDPQFGLILRERPRDAAAAFQKAVSAELLLERRRVIHQLNRMGAFTVDAQPDRLSAPLINRYLEARLGAVL